MTSLYNLNNLLSTLNYYKKFNSINNIDVSSDFGSRQFLKYAGKAQQFGLNISALKTDAYNVKLASCDVLRSNSSASINKKIVESSSEKIAGTAKNSADYASYTFKVEQLAQNQINKGNDLASYSMSQFFKGNNTFKISIGDKNSYMSIYINEGDSNKTILNKIANEINNSSIGVNAKIVSDDLTNTSAIVITSDKTGTKNAFSITDLEGNAAEISGIKDIDIQASDAKYLVDGKEYINQSNKIELGNGSISVELKGTTNQDEVKISIKDDFKAINESIDYFVANYNKMVDSINLSDEEFSDRIYKELEKTSSYNQSKLSYIGINIQSDGKLKVDEDRLKESIEKDSLKVKEAVGGYRGIADNASKFADRAMEGVFDISGQSFSYLDLSTYYQKGSKTLYTQNLVRGIFLDTLL